LIAVDETAIAPTLTGPALGSKKIKMKNRLTQPTR